MQCKDMSFIAQSLLCLLLGVASVFGQDFESVLDVKAPLKCERGFRFQENRGCIDVDECSEQAPCLVGQTCRNLYGSYLCICRNGYGLNKETGECEDVDECSMGFCGNGQECINTVGSFRCICSPGTTKIGRFCRDVNECVQQPCDSNQYCINTRGSYRCQCRRGYQDDGRGKCVDTDECAENMCQGFGERCQNTIGGYDCVCEDGYTKDQRTGGRYCVDVNECDLNPCSDHSECINSHGSFSCRCHEGFTKLNGVCVDDQECQLGEGSKCQWRCENRPGSFTCQCPSGYYKVDFACNDINECDVDGPNMCGDGRICVNTHGGYECVTPFQCSDKKFYRKLMTTDEFSYRQITTNICRRKKCRRLSLNETTYRQCRRLPLSVSHHYIDITSDLNVPASLLKIKFPARRRRQNYNFVIVDGDGDLFSLRQPANYRPLAFLVLNRSLKGPAKHQVKIDMRTYNRRGNMRDNRMLTIFINVSAYEF